MKKLILVLCAAICCTMSWSQDYHDDVTRNNIDALNYMFTNSTMTAYLPVIFSSGLSVEEMEKYSNIELYYTSYKLVFGEYEISEEQLQRNIKGHGVISTISSDDQKLTVNSFIIKKSEPNMMSVSYMGNRESYIRVVPGKQRFFLYSKEGELLDSSKYYVDVDEKGRIKTISNGNSAGYTAPTTPLTSFTYSGTGKLATVKRGQKTDTLKWDGDILVTIDSQYEKHKYTLEVIEKDAEGHWTRAVLSRSDSDGMIIPWYQLARIFNE